MARLIGLLASLALAAGHFGLAPAPVRQEQTRIAGSVHRWQAEQSAGIACAIRLQQGAESCAGR